MLDYSSQRGGKNVDKIDKILIGTTLFVALGSIFTTAGLHISQNRELNYVPKEDETWVAMSVAKDDVIFYEAESVEDAGEKWILHMKDGSTYDILKVQNPKFYNEEDALEYAEKLVNKGGDITIKDTGDKKKINR